MSSNRINKVPKRLLNECNFCHRKGIKPGILEIEFPQDRRTQEYFQSLVGFMDLDEGGRCKECSELLSRNIGIKSGS